MKWPEGSNEAKSLETYERLRELNPHLPPPDKVKPEWSIEYQPYAEPFVTLRVMVDVTGNDADRVHAAAVGAMVGMMERAGISGGVA